MNLERLIAELDAEDLEQARRMPPEEKLKAGGELFEDACQWTLAGIRDQYPGISDKQAMEELRRRVESSAAREFEL